MFQSFHLIPSLTAVENILVPMEIAGRRDAAARARGCWPKSVSRTAAITIRRSCPAASSSASRSRGRCRTSRSSCWPMSPPAIWTPQTGHHIIELLLGINERRGTTLVVVTHDQEIAGDGRCARIYLRDGQVAERGEGSTMRFVLLTALRETRSAWKRLVFFFVCIAIGVGAIVALRSVIQSVRRVLSTEARTLIAADILVSTDRPWQAGTPERIAAASPACRLGADRIDRDADDGAAGRRSGAVNTKVVELRAVQPGFPFYGQFTLQDGRPYSHACSRATARSCGRNCWRSSV